MLLGLFAGLAAILATVGIYGVLAQFVSLHTREFGVRKAMGADRARIGKLVLRRATLPLGGGMIVGIALSLMTGRVLAGLVHGVEPDNLAVIALACLVLGVAAIGGTLVPARRAMRVDPAEALRDE
jgi:putative ABC transport system permease protein